MRSATILLCILFFAVPAGAATCGGDFNAFLFAMSREAAAAGISRAVIDSAFAGVTEDAAVLSFDRRQRGTFRKSFEEYAAIRSMRASSAAWRCVSCAGSACRPRCSHSAVCLLEARATCVRLGYRPSTPA